MATYKAVTVSWWRMPGLLGCFFAAVTALLWSFVYPLSRFCMEQGLSPLEMAFWRTSLGGLAFLIYCLARNGLRVSFRLGAMLLAFGAIGVAASFGIVFVAIEGCGVAMSSILMYTAPPLVALLSWLFFREQPGRALLFSLGISLCGVALVSLSGGGLDGGASRLGLLSGALSGLLYALHFLVVKYLLAFCSAATLYAYAFSAAALVFLPFVPFTPKSPQVWAALVGMAFVSTFCAFLLYGKALSLLRSTQVAAIVNLDPIFSTSWAFFFFGEILSPLGMFGGLLVLTGVALSLIGKKSTGALAPV